MANLFVRGLIVIALLLALVGTLSFNQRAVVTIMLLGIVFFFAITIFLWAKDKFIWSFNAPKLTPANIGCNIITSLAGISFLSLIALSLAGWNKDIFTLLLTTFLFSLTLALNPVIWALGLAIFLWMKKNLTPALGVSSSIIISAFGLLAFTSIFMPDSTGPEHKIITGATLLILYTSWSTQMVMVLLFSARKIHKAAQKRY